MNFAVDFEQAESRTGQIVVLDDFLEYSWRVANLVHADSVTGVHSILLDADFARIRAALRSSSNAALRLVAGTWAGAYPDVLRALFAYDATPPWQQERYRQPAPYAEAYLARVLRAHAAEVDWRSVLERAVRTDRVTLVDAALVDAPSTRALFGRATAPDAQPTHDALGASAMLALARTLASARVQRVLIRYIRVRASAHVDFRDAFIAHEGALPSSATL